MIPSPADAMVQWGAGLAAQNRQALTGRGHCGQVDTAASGSRGHPPRSYLARVERGNPVGVQAGARSADREEGVIPQRDRTAREANAGGRKAAGNRDDLAAPSAAVADNWPDTAYAEPERVLTWAG